MARLFLDPGQLNARLRIEMAAGISDGQGGVDEGGGWLPVADVWGQVEPVRAIPAEEAGAVVAPVRHRVTIRHRGDVQSAMRFVYRGRSLRIYGVRDPDESRRYLVCDCEEGEA